MKTTAILVTLWVLTAFCARAEDWVTTDGKTYRNAKELSHDAGFVTIMYADGGARVPLATLPPDLQKRFGYNPAQAAAAVAATIAADKRDRAALMAEAQSVEANRKKMQEQPAAPPPAPIQPSPAISPVVAVATAPAQHAPTHAAAPAIDVTANKVKIEKDQEDLANLEVDIRDAGREHPSGEQSSTVGESALDRIDALLQRRQELKAEIAELQKQDQSVEK